jgi:DNA repair exonuclease SbcCD nuclease subunit
MLRLLHIADVHLGARHADLGDAATAQRERQFAAFRAAIDLAIEEHVDLVLIAGDLFDSNTQPRRSVERVAAELERLAKARIRTVVIPGTHDCYDRSSIYRAYDLKALAGSTPEDDFVTVMTPERPSRHLAALDTVVHAVVFPQKRASHSPLRDLRVERGPGAEPSATWHVGMVHGALAIPDRTDRDEVVVTKEEIAATGLDYLALGHWHSVQKGKAGATTYAYSGAPEPVAVDQDGAGNALLVTMEERAGSHAVTVEERRVGKTRFERLDIDTGRLKLQLAAERGGGVGLLLRTAGKHASEHAVVTRWLVGPMQGQRNVQRWRIQLIFGHGGRVGETVILEHHRDPAAHPLRPRFEAHPLHPPAELADRPDAAEAGRVTA